MGFDSGSEVLAGGDPNGFTSLNGGAAIIAPYGGLYAHTGNNAVVANRSYFVRFVPLINLLISHIAFCISVAAGSNDNCDAGIYSAAGNLLGNVGSTAGKLNAAQVQTLTLATPIQLVAGSVYYGGFAAGPIGTTAASIVSTSIAASAMNLVGANLPQQLQAFVGAFPLPANFVASGPIGSCPILALLP